jgi:hypothetical protein
MFLSFQIIVVEPANKPVRRGTVPRDRSKFGAARLQGRFGDAIRQPETKAKAADCDWAGTIARRV